MACDGLHVEDFIRGGEAKNHGLSNGKHQAG